MRSFTLLAVLALIFANVEAHSFISTPTSRGGGHSGYEVAPCGDYPNPIPIRNIVPYKFPLNFTNIANETATYTVKVSFSDGTNLANSSFTYEAATGEAVQNVTTTVALDFSDTKVSDKSVDGVNATIQLYYDAEYHGKKGLYACVDVTFNATTTEVVRPPKPSPSVTTASATASATVSPSPKSAGERVAGSLVTVFIVLVIAFTLA